MALSMTTPEPNLAAPGRRLDRLADRYLDYLKVERGVALNTVSAYARDLRLYLGALGERGIASPAAIDEACITEFLGDLRKREYAPGRRYSDATVARVLAAVRGFHRYMVRENVTAGDPSEPLGSMRIPRSLPKALSHQEVEMLLHAVPSEGPAAVRDRAMLELLYAAGLRISELTALDVDDLDLEPRHDARGALVGGYTVRCQGKGSKVRVVPVGRAAVECLEAYLTQIRPQLAKRRSEHALFLNQQGRRLTRQGCWKLIKRYADRAGISRRVSPHTLRHSFATHLIDAGADVRVVQELLGHASVSTTSVYKLVSQETIRDVYYSAHPRAGRAPARRS